MKPFSKFTHSIIAASYIFAQPVYAASCNYRASGPVVAAYDGQVFHNLNITAFNTPAINTNGHSGVGVSGVIIHQYGPASAIVMRGGAYNWVASTSIYKMDAPARGENTGFYDGIYCYQSPNLFVKGLTVKDVSAGIWLQQCNNSRLMSIEAYNIRGPFYHGQMVAFVGSANSSLVNFYSFNDPLISAPEDNVNAWQSSNITISNGLIDGNNAPRGVGVQIDAGSYNIAVSNVDVIHAMSGCFAAYGPPRWNVSFSNVRCRDMVSASFRGGTNPKLGGIGFAFYGPPLAHHVSGIDYYNASYFNVPLVAFNEPGMEISQFTSEDFTPIAPFHNNLCE